VGGQDFLSLSASGFSGFRDFQDFISEDDVVGRASRKLYKNQHHLPLTTYYLPFTTYHLPFTTYHSPLKKQQKLNPLYRPTTQSSPTFVA
jgi:hypothetical protein